MKKKSIVSKLSLSLLSLYSATSLSATGEAETWKFKGDAIIYQEQDRVMATEANISGKYFIDTDESIGFKASVDALTGSSPSGQIISTRSQTFTGASGTVFNIPPGNTPLQEGYNELRGSGSVDYSKNNNAYAYGIVGNISVESDYVSIGLSSSFSIFFNNKNTTLEIALATNYDRSDGYFGTPQPLTMVLPNSQSRVTIGKQSKQIFDLILGFTQITDKYSFISVLFSAGQQKGYLTDPYKVISVVDDITGAPVSFAASHPNFPSLQKLLYEKRPDIKDISAFYIAYKRSVGRGVMNISGRYYDSDWGVHSTTFDFAISAYVSENIWLRPNLRYYQQNSADFYQAFITENNFQRVVNNNQTIISSDARLGSLTGITLGLEIGFDNESFTLGIEAYQQDIHEPGNKFGILREADIIPDLNALIVRSNFWF